MAWTEIMRPKYLPPAAVCDPICAMALPTTPHFREIRLVPAPSEPMGNQVPFL